MSGDTRPPHPGAAPDPFDFPFSEARAAREAVEALADELRRLRTTHRDARGDVEAGVFEGTTADRWRDRFDASMDELDQHVGALDGQVDQIEADIARARARAEADELAHLRWRRAHDAWATWTPPVLTGLPFQGWARSVQSVVTEVALQSTSGARVDATPTVVPDSGTSKRQIRLTWSQPLRGRVCIYARMDRPQ